LAPILAVLAGLLIVGAVTCAKWCPHFVRIPSVVEQGIPALRNENVWLPSVLGMSGAWLAMLALTAYLYVGTASARLLGIRAYLKALAVLSFGVLVAAFGFCLGLALHLHTTLELTPQFWIAVGVTSALAAVVCQITASERFRSPFSHCLRAGITYLRSSQVIMRRHTTPARTLVVFVGLTLLVWIGISPALYDNANARRFFQTQATEWSTRAGTSASEPALTANLIVTATTLGPFSLDKRGRPAGDVYFCFGLHCPPAPDIRWQTSTKVVWGELLDAVFASGSPFPVFPELSISRTTFAGKFVDGGYVHNVPLDAARLAGAGAALILYSEPRPTTQTPATVYDTEIGGLVRNARRLIPFMFDRSQEADRSGSQGMFVVGVAPRGDGRDFPLLTDFRVNQIQRLVQCARCDVQAEAPIGLVESWGVARVFRTIRSTDTLTQPGWTSHVKETLQTAMSFAPKDSIAVFDMDNTLLQNDLGDAVMRKLVLSLAYRGDKPEFWSLIADTKRRDKLRAFYERHNEELRRSPPSVDAALSQSQFAELKAHFVLFQHEYEERLKRNERKGCEWAAQLLMGLSEQQVTELTDRTWREELATPVTTVQLTDSQALDSSVKPLDIHLGIRVRPQLVELISQLRQRNIGVYIASATNQLSVRYAAAKVGIEPANAHGIEVTVDVNTGALSSSIVQPSTYGPGKITAIPEFERKAWLVVGDSVGDLQMLRRSNKIALVLDHGRISEPHGSAKEPRWLLQPSSELDAAAQ
jgi:phosphoserine phosphatase